MSEQSLMEKIGATPRKLALVAVLAIVFVLVIVFQLPEQSTAPVLARKRPSARNRSSKRISAGQEQADRSTRASLTGSSSAQDKLVSSQTSPAWPEIPLEEFVRYDPFATPAWLENARNAILSPEEKSRLAAIEERKKRQQEVLNQLREQGAKAVVISGKEKHAVIGEHVVRIGDSIDGFRISDITKDGIVLTELGD